MLGMLALFHVYNGFSVDNSAKYRIFFLLWLRLLVKSFLTLRLYKYSLMFSLYIDLFILVLYYDLKKSIVVFFIQTLCISCLRHIYFYNFILFVLLLFWIYFLWCFLIGHYYSMGKFLDLIHFPFILYDFPGIYCISSETMTFSFQHKIFILL